MIILYYIIRDNVLLCINSNNVYTFFGVGPIFFCKDYQRIFLLNNKLTEYRIILYTFCLRNRHIICIYFKF